jgi:hypothetical protein
MSVRAQRAPVRKQWISFHWPEPSFECYRENVRVGHIPANMTLAGVSRLFRSRFGSPVGKAVKPEVQSPTPSHGRLQHGRRSSPPRGTPTVCRATSAASFLHSAERSHSMHGHEREILDLVAPIALQLRVWTLTCCDMWHYRQ